MSHNPKLNTQHAYIHIPFCKQKCLYCDFNSFDNQDNLIQDYIKALMKEIKWYEIKYLHTIYIGGGTPSYIDEKYIVDILGLLPKSEETTIEVNPCSVTCEKLIAYKNAGINRISIGLQTTHDYILKLIGRVHNLKQFEEAYELIRKEGFNNVNVDLMFGLPSQTLESFKESVEYLIKLKPEHISAYSLILHKDIFKDLPSEEEERAMYHFLIERLKEAGYNHYEISNFSLPGYESKHNLAYWNQKEYYGFGAGASSFLDNKRYTNIKNINKYISLNNKNIEAHTVHQAINNEITNDLTNDVRILEEELNEDSKLNEYMILKLRLIEGVNIKETNEKFKTDILRKYEEQLKKLQDWKLINIDDNIKLTKKGLDLANIVWEQFV